MSLDNYVAPVFLTDQAKKLNNNFYLLLNRLVTTYPASKLSPDAYSQDNSGNNTNINVYNANMALMLKLQNDYFVYKNTILKNSQDLMAFVSNVDDQINILDHKNQVLSAKLGEMANSTHSAEGMLDDSQLTRNQLFVGNIILLIIMSTGGYMYYRKLTNK